MKLILIGAALNGAAWGLIGRHLDMPTWAMLLGSVSWAVGAFTVAIAMSKAYAASDEH